MRSPLRPAVFLDRDGVLVDVFVRDGAPFAATTLDEFRIAEGAAQQVQRLRQAGFPCVVFTNQPEIARGAIDPAALAGMHERLRREVPVDAIYVCPHDDPDGCDCRKPKPGMLQAAARDLGLDLAASVVIGDRWRDIGAGRAAGCRTVLIRSEYDDCSTADVTVSGLQDAVDAALEMLKGAEVGARQRLS